MPILRKRIWWFVSSRTAKYYPCNSCNSRDLHDCRGGREPDAVTSMMQKVVQAGYRSLALVLHPDKGGSHDDMIVLNTAVQRLREEVGSR